MTTSMVEGGAGTEEEEGEGMYALSGDHLFNIAGGQLEEGRETSLYIVSEGVREYSNGGSNRKGFTRGSATFLNLLFYKTIASCEN